MPEDAKTLLRRVYEEASAGNLGVIDDLLTDDFLEHEEMQGFEQDREGVKGMFAMFRAAFPDLRMEPREMLADGDLVSCRAVCTGTNQGELMGMPPSGKRIEIELIDILRVRDGQFAEHWGVMDTMGMMQQLGAIPEQAPA